MAELTNYQSVSLTDMFKNIQQVQENPTLMFRTIIETFDEVVNGEIALVDPSNPTVWLLSTSCVMAAANMQESILNLRKQYPELSQIQEDLYPHMSDSDYVGRFATAANTKATLVLDWGQLVSSMVYDPDMLCKKAIVPRDTTITVDGVRFTMQYPVEIKYFDNGVLNVAYDTSIATPLFKLTTNEIQYKLNRDANNAAWLFFDVDVLQTAVTDVEETVQKSRRINTTVNITDKFFAVRAFYRNPNNADEWLEMHISHSDLVYDPFKPTACVQVFEDRVNIQIPTVYQNSGLVEGVVRFYVYTTKGAVAYNFGTYPTDAFMVDLQALDRARDMPIFASIMNRVSIHAMITGTVTGGSDPIPFETLRERTISNSTGVGVIPITPAKIQSFTDTKGFELITHVDILTDRVFLATRKLPKPSNKRLLTAANVGLNTLMTTLQAVEQHPYVHVNGKRWTLSSEALYKQENGIVSIVQGPQHQQLKNTATKDLVDELNNNRYLYSPFHYVLDSSDLEFTTRAYYLDKPDAKNINFIRQNQTLELIVNTASYYIERITSGWRLFVTTQSGNFYKQLAPNQCSAQLLLYPMGQTSASYINAVFRGTTDTGERIFSFDLETNFDIDDNHYVRITNAQVPGVRVYDVRTHLTPTVELIYTTTSLTPGYKPDASDALIAKEMLPTGSAAITTESIDLMLGYVLDNLWTRTRSLPVGLTYKRYTENIPKTYKEDVYEINPVTGSMFTVIEGRLVYKKLHSRGEVVYDADNNVVYEHQIGDVEFDQMGEPIVLPLGLETKEVDMVFVDARHKFVTDETFVEYKDEFAQVLVEWITQDLQDIQDVLLEKTRIYFYPKNHLNVVDVYLSDNQTARLSAEQSFVVDLDVPYQVYANADVRQKLKTLTISLLDSMVGGSEVNLSDINVELKKVYKGSNVQSFSISGLGGELNLRYLKLKNNHESLCLKRVMQLQPDGTTIITEDVTVNFHLLT